MSREPYIERRRVLFYLFTTVLLSMVALSGTGNAAVSKAMLEATPEALEKGRAIYDGSCIFCHGIKGKGDG
ncbi:MAG: c-type cytochrome, partial [Nitrospirota bacterium]|nr:c-type cytochrome [Nitrospirota bacterium]